MVQPRNLPDVVQEFIALLALIPDQLFLLEQNDPGYYITLHYRDVLPKVNVVRFSMLL